MTSIEFLGPAVLEDRLCRSGLFQLHEAIKFPSLRTRRAVRNVGLEEGRLPKGLNLTCAVIRLFYKRTESTQPGAWVSGRLGGGGSLL